MILAFLHGKGADKNAYDEQLKKLAKNLSADILSFNAPRFLSYHMFLRQQNNILSIVKVRNSLRNCHLYKQYS